MNHLFLYTQFLLEAVQERVKELTGMQKPPELNVITSQDWKTFRWGRLTLIDDPPAEIIRMRVDVLSDLVGHTNFHRSEKRMISWR